MDKDFEVWWGVEYADWMYQAAAGQFVAVVVVVVEHRQVLGLAVDIVFGTPHSFDLMV